MTGHNALGFYNIVYIFSGANIHHEMTLTDFEAVYDRVAPIESLSAKGHRCALVSLDRALKVDHIVLFKTPFDSNGYISPEWDYNFQNTVEYGSPLVDREHDVELYDASSVRRKADRKWLWSGSDHATHVITQILERVDENRLRFIADTEETVLIDLDSRREGLASNEHVDRLQAQLAEQAAVIGELSRLVEQRETQVNSLNTTVSQLQVELTKAYQRERKSRAPASFKDALRQMMAANLEVRYTFDKTPLTYRQMVDHLDDPVGAMARACRVGRNQFLAWQTHASHTVCEHIHHGVMCGQSVERVDDPRQFVSGTSDRCHLHQQLLAIAR